MNGRCVRASRHVQRFGADFLAGAAFAGDEHRRLRRRDALDLLVERTHRGRCADEAFEAGCSVLVPGAARRCSARALAHAREQAPREFRRLKRFHDENRRRRRASPRPRLDDRTVAAGRDDRPAEFRRRAVSRSMFGGAPRSSETDAPANGGSTQERCRLMGVAVSRHEDFVRNGRMQPARSQAGGAADRIDDRRQRTRTGSGEPLVPTMAGRPLDADWLQARGRSSAPSRPSHWPKQGKQTFYSAST